MKPSGAPEWGFPEMFVQTIASQLEVTLHAPNGSPSFIKQPYHGYQTLYFEKNGNKIIFTPGDALILGMFNSFPPGTWNLVVASPEYQAELYELAPECTGEWAWVAPVAREPLEYCKKMFEFITNQLYLRAGPGRIWLPGHVPTEEEVASLIAEPPDWAYFDGPR